MTFLDASLPIWEGCYKLHTSSTFYVHIILIHTITGVSKIDARFSKLKNIPYLLIDNGEGK